MVVGSWFQFPDWVLWVLIEWKRLKAPQGCNRGEHCFALLQHFLPLFLFLLYMHSKGPAQWHSVRHWITSRLRGVLNDLNVNITRRLFHWSGQLEPLSSCSRCCSKFSLVALWSSIFTCFTKHADFGWLSNPMQRGGPVPLSSLPVMIMPTVELKPLNSFSYHSVIYSR